MSPRAGFVLQDQVIPRLRSAIPTVCHCVGSEDAQELIQDSIAMAAVGRPYPGLLSGTSYGVLELARWGADGGMGGVRRMGCYAGSRNRQSPNRQSQIAKP
jgi:hypothetical protein